MSYYSPHFDAYYAADAFESISKGEIIQSSLAISPFALINLFNLVLTLSLHIDAF